MTVTVRTDEGGIPVAMIDPAARLKAEEYRAVKQGFWDAWNPRYRAITDKKNRGEWFERFSVYLDGQYSARAYHKAVELRTHTSRNRKIRALAQEMLGKSVADVVPLPAFPSEQVREYIRASKAASTLRGYKSDWRHFCAWCEGHNQCPLPASSEITAVYIAECAEHLKVGSIQRRLNAIAEAHKATGLESPTHSSIVANTMKGIRRTKGTAPIQKRPH